MGFSINPCDLWVAWQRGKATTQKSGGGVLPIKHIYASLHIPEVGGHISQTRALEQFSNNTVRGRCVSIMGTEAWQELSEHTGNEKNESFLQHPNQCHKMIIQLIRYNQHHSYLRFLTSTLNETHRRYTRSILGWSGGAVRGTYWCLNCGP